MRVRKEENIVSGWNVKVATMNMNVKRRNTGITRLFLLVILGVLSISGCSARVGDLERDVKELDRKVGDLRSFQAEQTARVDGLNEQLRTLIGKIEELQHGQQLGGYDAGGKLARMDGQGNETLQSDSYPSVGRPAAPPAIVPDLELEADEVSASRIQGRTGELLTTALANIRAGQFAPAARLLDELRAVELGAGARQEGGGLLPLVYFWRGVTADGLRDNTAALKNYNDLISEFQQHPRTTVALLRLGSVFIRLGDSNTARLTFQKLITEYPDSLEAERAKERLRDLRG